MPAAPSDATEVLVAALLTDWGHLNDPEPDPRWERAAHRVAAVVDTVRPLGSQPDPLEGLVTALKTKPRDNAERARMCQAAIERIAEVRDLAVKAVWATRTGNPTATELARHLHLPPGLVNQIIHTERR